MNKKQSICKNCKNHFYGNFCNNCGQSVSTHKLNISYIIHDIQYGLFHFDHGIIYTAKMLFTIPGKTIRDFINGKRVKLFKPISLVIVLATIYEILNHYFNINIIGHGDIILNGKSINYDKINNWITNNFAIVTLISIPFYTISSFLFFKKQGYNIIEHLVLNAFVASQRLIVFIAFIPIIYLTDSQKSLHLISEIILFIDLILLLWCYTGFFNKLPKFKVLFLTVLSFTLVIILLLTFLVSCLNLFS